MWLITKHDGTYFVEAGQLLQKLGYKNTSYKNWFHLANKYGVTVPYDNHPYKEGMGIWIDIDKAMTFIIQCHKPKKALVLYSLLEDYIKEKRL